MPVVKCILCGYKTNSATSKYWGFNDGFAHGCYARLNKGDKWERGCHYVSANTFEKEFADELIGMDWEKLKKEGEEILFGKRK